MNDNGMVLALDVGERRIGVAMASRIARLPAPYVTLDRQRVLDAAAEIERIVKKEAVDTVVVGLPRNMQGNETEQTKRARRFAEALQARLTCPVVMQDEAATSVQAEERLRARNKPYAKEDIDAEAAAIILQDYLSQTEQRLA